MKGKVVHLNRYFHFTELMRDASVEAQILRYRSEYDNTYQSLFVMKPVRREPEKLFFFFHGMDGDCGDALVIREAVKCLNAKVICIGGRGPSWVSDAFLADSQQVISRHIRKFNAFYLIGISMGGTQALSVAGLLPKNLRQRLSGVIAIIPGTNLIKIEYKSSNPMVKSTLLESANKDLKKLKSRSPMKLIDKYSRKLPFIVFYNEKDTILLAEETIKFIESLQKKAHPVSIFTAPGEHNFTYTKIDYKKLFESMGNNSAEKKKIPVKD